MIKDGKIDIEEILKEKKHFIDKRIEKYLPRKIDSKSLEFMIGKPRYEYSISAIQNAIVNPIWDLLDRGGKRWRPALFLMIAEALNGDIEKVSDFVIIPEVVHDGTLMADDVEDSSALRRGKPCTHVIFGADIAINAAEAMYFIPTLVLRKNRNFIDDKILLRAYEIYHEDLTSLTVAGQAVDIYWHRGFENVDEITENKYLQMCAGKTGSLARMSARLAAALSGASEKQEFLLGRFAETIGVAFQIQDDILNLTAESGKGQFIKEYIGSDITEGKRTLMIIHALKKATKEEKARLIEILNMHTNDKKLIYEAIAIIKKYGSVEYAKNRAKEIVKDAWKDVDSVLPESKSKDVLSAFADYLIERDI
ncbi:MAG: polyprenyl synthetase family protein [Nanoarchaeota archaeon]|nr:polyprenyl synthetase family protein [Nanoarchaeota archaeon]MBU4300398.1 polyprenyl synthetase family protein [Nanoarchaeota archaeon]MBU4451350.1 polyprenyl synthetase family protein [Nanoarchaeota archaeon]MCG2723753.1 polyprenyl synthetase family protein [archaeon]